MVALLEYYAGKSNLCSFSDLKSQSMRLGAKLLCSQASSGLVVNVFHITISPLDYCVVKRFSYSTLIQTLPTCMQIKKRLDEQKLFYENRIVHGGIQHAIKHLKGKNLHLKWTQLLSAN